MSHDSSPSEVPLTSSRRLFLKGAVVAAVAAAGSRLVGAGAAGAATKTTKQKATTTTKKKTVASTATVVAPSSTKAPSPVAEKPAAGSFDPANEVAVTFAYTADGGFRVRNPYVAVYIEDTAGTLVRTIDLSVQLGKGLRWLPDLSRWFRADQHRLNLGGADVVHTMSTATRVPGTYTVSWDERDEHRALVPLGDYYLCIEGAREKGPYELIREQITIGYAAFSKQLPPNGELTAASVELRARK